MTPFEPSPPGSACVPAGAFPYPLEMDPIGIASILATTRRVHFVGIGGSGMSGLARVLRRRGFQVSGSDGKASAATALLEREGIRIAIGHDPSVIDFDDGFVVLSAAVPADNPEVVAAAAKRLPMAKYAAALGGAVATRRVVAIAGCHGKTTTTALTTFLLRRAGVDCGFVIGGRVPQLDGNAGEGRAREFVVEACEYDRSFFHFSAAAAAITNLDADHLDYYGSFDAVADAFAQFVLRMRSEGMLVTTPEAWKVLAPRLEASPDWAAKRVRVRTVGIGAAADDRIVPVRVDPDRNDGTRSAMRIVAGHNDLGLFHLRLSGTHNLSNAAMAVLLALELGADLEAVRRALADFHGVDRRLTVHLESPELTVVDDYGHHPAELRATIAAARERFLATGVHDMNGASRRLVLVFQPHQYSRTRLLFADFVEALQGADRVILPEIFAARDNDEDRKAVSSAQLVEALRAKGVDADFAPTLDGAAELAWSGRRPGDVILTSGAGDVDRVADELVRRASAR